MKSKDTFSKSDSYVKVECEMKGQKFILGTTETIQNNDSPVFNTSIPIEYVFEVNQQLYISVLDHDTATGDDVVGTGTCNMGNILASPGFFTLSLQKGSVSTGTLQIKYDKVATSNNTVIFNISCSNVKDIETFSKSDPFLRIYRAAPGIGYGMDPSQYSEDSWTKIHDTECVKDNLNPVFREFSINGGRLCQNNPDSPIKFEIWDYSNRGYHEIIGKGFTTLNKMLQGVDRTILTRNSNGKNTGTVNINKIQTIVDYDIIDYVRAGMTMNLAIGIDFTGSNGEPSSSSSLHYISNNLNQYQRAIKEIGQILIAYDNDKVVPSFGFGASIQGTTKHCFPLSLEGTPNVPSWEGTLQAYQKCLKSVELSGPTNFSPLIKTVKAIVQENFNKNPLNYTVLLIITDGQISDMSETVREISSASVLPMSIIIVGVGEADFDNMEDLDGDSKKVSGGAAGRDIVQFVNFNSCKGNGALLAENVLKELPGQVNRFYYSIGKQPVKY